MKKGDLVNIYEDFMTCHKLEGQAHLIRKTRGRDKLGTYCGKPLERWIVAFNGEDMEVERTIVVS